MQGQYYLLYVSVNLDVRWCHETPSPHLVPRILERFFWNFEFLISKLLMQYSSVQYNVYTVVEYWKNHILIQWVDSSDFA